jgi:hypothetical protein
MKNLINKAFMIFLTLGGTTFQAYSWVYEFHNNTNDTVAIGMRYKGTNESLKFRTIDPNTAHSFKPGDADISAWKKASVADAFYYLKNPPTITESSKSNVAWEDVSIIWLDRDIYGKAMLLSETAANEISELLESANQSIVEPTMAKSHRIDVIEDENGKIYFISVP